MNFKIYTAIALIVCSTLGVAFTSANDWGFFGHRRINRMAVFTLPQEMILFFKQNIEFLTEHAVDPDKRRYATKHEAVRHYIDIDHWGVYPFVEVPRKWKDVITKYVDINVVTAENDTVLLFGNGINVMLDGNVIIHSDLIPEGEMPKISYEEYSDFVQEYIISQYYEDDWFIECERLDYLLSETGIKLNCIEAFAKDKFSKYGILPYHLEVQQDKLTKAFMSEDPKRILQLAAEMGHYIGDAHVPLHTTENYNGQLTNQDGIHGFWESRIPELFADNEFDYFVGQAEYIEDKNKYFWDIVMKSNTYVDSLLSIEKTLSKTFPQDKQYCYEDRLEATIRTQCKDYTAAFRRLLDGQVEARMTASILSVGSVWFTAWVDAGQPDLSFLGEYQADKDEMKRQEELEKIFRSGEIKGRGHDN